MATATPPKQVPGIEPGRRLLTAADLVALPERLPSGPVSFELHHGRLVPMSPPGARHGNLQARIGGALLSQGELKGHGHAYTEVGVVLARNPDHVLGPDAAFVTTRSFPVKLSPEGYLETIPDLVVEIRSKNDTLAEVNDKIADYLKAGVLLAWFVDPATKTVVENRPNGSPKTLRAEDVLTCDDIIPDFRLPLAELFRE